jgi:hypothetical protein
MRSTDEGKRHSRSTRIAVTATRREGSDETPIAVIKPWEGLGGLMLLFLASLAYVVSGGAFAPDPSPLPQADTRIAAMAMPTAGAGGAPRKRKISGLFALPGDYFASAYARRDRGGDAMFMNSAHD